MSSTSALNSLLTGSSSSSSPIDISSILAAVAGTSTPGIDVTSAVNAALYADRAPERVWQTEQTTLSSQATALQSIHSASSSLQTDMQGLNSLTGPLSARTVSSSNASSVTATAASGTVTGTHHITVGSLATTASWYSDEETSATATLPASSFTITTASGAATITTGSGVDTLNDVASAINTQSLGITASVVNDATGSRLSIVSNNSGSAANFSIASTTPGGIGFTQAVAGNNASLTVDGVPVSSATNTVTGAISGVTLNLLSPTTTGSPANLSVATDTSQITSAVNQFVSDYNSAVSLLNTQFTYSASSSSEGALASDPTIRSLQQTLQSIASYTASSSSTGGASSNGVASLSDLGISVGTDGTLTINSATLNSVLSNNPAGAQNFLQGTALNGFANTANNALNNFTDPGDGAFTVDLSSLSNQYNSFAAEISDFETNYIAQQQTTLNAEYSKAEIALQSLPTEMAQIQNELGNNTKSS